MTAFYWYDAVDFFRCSAVLDSNTSSLVERQQTRNIFIERWWDLCVCYLIFVESPFKLKSSLLFFLKLERLSVRHECTKFSPRNFVSASIDKSFVHSSLISPSPLGVLVGVGATTTKRKSLRLARGLRVAAAPSTIMTTTTTITMTTTRLRRDAGL